MHHQVEKFNTIVPNCFEIKQLFFTSQCSEIFSSNRSFSVFERICKLKYQIVF